MTTHHRDGPGDTATRRRGALVLIVDDFEDNRAMYVEYLTRSGYSVAEAADGEEAVRMTQDLLPDLVIMDLSLPIMDGLEATRVLKRDERTRHIPIVALTGHALGSDSTNALEAGCHEVLSKPCLPRTLAERVELVLAGVRPKKRSPEPRRAWR